mgnify:CR=1 FL=1
MGIPGGLIGPVIGLGVLVRDNDDLHSDIDDFQDADNRLQAAKDAGDPAAIEAASKDMLNIIHGLDGKNMAVDASAVLAMGMAFESFSMAVSIRSDAICAGTVTDLSTDLTLFSKCCLHLALYKCEKTHYKRQFSRVIYVLFAFLQFFMFFNINDLS